jgi:hypothetical protein
MRETITFPRPYHRPLTSVVLFALLGALMLVLARPGAIHTQPPQGPITVPAGTTFIVATVSEISSKMSVGARFDARLIKDLYVDGHLVTPAGTEVYGVVTRSEGGKEFGKQQLATTLNGISWKGQVVPLLSDTAGVSAKPGGGFVKIGGGRMVGAAVAGLPGAIVGGLAGKVVSKKTPRHITLPAGKELDVHLRMPVHLP